MNTYLINKKVEYIKRARESLFSHFGIDHTPFTRKIYFYFIEFNKKKFVYKEALQFIYSNAETYTTEINPQWCGLTKQIEPVDVIGFLETYKGSLLPSLLESNDDFLVYDYIDSVPLEEITRSEFYDLKQYHTEMNLTPFYSSMTYNLTRSSQGVKLVDLKHFEPKKDLPFFVYFYNKDNAVNTLYLEIDTEPESILKHLELDYPVRLAKVIKY